MGGKPRRGRVLWAVRPLFGSTSVYLDEQPGLHAVLRMEWFQFEALGGPALAPGVPTKVRVVIEEVE